MTGIDIRSVGDAVLYLGAVAAALAALGMIFRFMVLVPLKRWITEQVVSPVLKVKSEITTNSGSSMKDDVSSVRESVDKLNKNLNAHIESTAPRDWRITALEIRMDQVAGRLDDHVRDHPGPTAEAP
jgi:hypothetical protein